MWGGRFGEGPGVIMREINASIPFDKRLWQEDIAGSKAHADMLAANGIITASDNAAIQSGLDSIYAEYAANGVPEDLTLEDIHMVTETRLRALVGEPAARLHTARSRNDQVLAALRLYLRDAVEEVAEGARRVSIALEALAVEDAAIDSAMQTMMQAFEQGSAPTAFRVILKDTVVVGYSGKQQKVVSVSGEEWAKGFQPAPDEDQRHRQYQILDITDTGAVVKVMLDYPLWLGVDYLAMTKINGQWRVVSKSWSGTPKVAK